MPSVYSSECWQVETTVVKPITNAYVEKAIISGAYLLETLLVLTATPTYSYLDTAGNLVINYDITETEPTAPSLTALDLLFTTFGFTVL